TAQSDAPVIYKLGCDNWYYSDRVLFCMFGPPNAAHTAVLMGDSIAAQWFPAVAEVFQKADWRLLFLTKSSCPMVDESFFYAKIGREYTVCSTWRRRALEQVAALKPDMVLLSSAPTYNFMQTQWVDGTKKVLGDISASVGHIYILRGTPHLPFDGPGCLAENSGRPAWFSFRRACSAPSTDEYADDVYQWLQQASGHFSNVTTVDMNDLICPNGMCVAEQNGEVVFRDSQHMTAMFAASLGTALKSRLDFKDFQAVSRANSHSLQSH
ncbi:MAG TPA: SGNH hydrolase domain-containing protein, partial [Rhodanobacter sp.]